MGAYYLLVVDGLPLNRTAVRQIVRGDPEAALVVEAATGHEALRLTKLYLPDLVLINVDLPGLSGVEIAGGIFQVAGGAGARVLMMGATVDDERLVKAVRIGTSGFLDEAREPEEMLEGIRATIAGANLWPATLRDRPAVAERVIMAAMHGLEGAATDRGPEATLTSQEMAVLDCLVLGLGYREMAGALFVAESTVRNQMSQLLRKLGVAGRLDALRYAVAHGWARFGAPPLAAERGLPGGPEPFAYEPEAISDAL